MNIKAEVYQDNKIFIENQKSKFLMILETVIILSKDIKHFKKNIMLFKKDIKMLNKN